jgi:hypothetical protein
MKDWIFSGGIVLPIVKSFEQQVRSTGDVSDARLQEDSKSERSDI